MLERMWKSCNIHTLLVGMEMVQAILENSLAVSYKSKHATTIQPSNFTPGDLSHKSGILCSYKNLYTNFHSNLSVMPPKWKRPRRPSMDNGYINFVHTNYGLLLSNKKEWTMDICNNLDEVPENYAE